LIISLFRRHGSYALRADASRAERHGAPSASRVADAPAASRAFLLLLDMPAAARDAILRYHFTPLISHFTPMQSLYHFL